MLNRYLTKLCNRNAAIAHADMVRKDMALTSGNSSPFVYWLSI